MFFKITAPAPAPSHTPWGDTGAQGYSHNVKKVDLVSLIDLGIKTVMP